VDAVDHVAAHDFSRGGVELAEIFTGFAEQPVARHGETLPADVSDRLLTAREVGDRLAVLPETALRWWRSGELPGFRLASNCLRFAEADVEAWLEARRTVSARLAGRG
jgi:excisionase family DNA binding protein